MTLLAEKSKPPHSPVPEQKRGPTSLVSGCTRAR